MKIFCGRRCDCGAMISLPVGSKTKWNLLVGSYRRVFWGSPRPPRRTNPPLPANIFHQMRRKALDCSTLLEQRTVSDDRQSKVWPIDPATLTEKSEEASHRSTNDWTEWSILWFRSSFIFTPFPTPRPPRNHHPPPLRYQFTRTLLMVVLRISKHFFLSAPCTS